MSRVLVRPLKTSINTGPKITMASLALFGPVNVAFVPQMLMPVGGMLPYTFSALGLPPGVALDPLTGIISGTPTVVGSTTATATVTDAFGDMASTPVFFGVSTPLFEQWADNFPDVGIGNFNLRGDYTYFGTTGRTLSVAANRFTFGAGPGGAPCVGIVPVQLSGAFSKDQFSEAVYAQDSGTNANPARWALYALLSGVDSAAQNFFQGYCVVIRANPAVNNVILARVSGWVSTTVTFVTFATIAVPAIGTLVRLEARLLGGSTSLRLLYNGVQVATGLEVGGITKGLPAFGSAASDSPVSTFGFEAFAAGKL